MFDIGFPELMLVMVVALLVLGPERLPEAIRTLSLWVGRFRRMARSAKEELDKEIGMEDIRRQLHNEQIMRDLGEARADIKRTLTDTPPAPEATPQSPPIDAAGSEPAQESKPDRER